MIKWIVEGSRPVRIVQDREFIKLMTAGRPHLTVPSPMTISRDIKDVFDASREKIHKLLLDHPGRLHFSTDTWTSPNQRAFVAWVVHLEHDGHMLSFLLDVLELPKSHTGDALAKAFHAMLLDYGIENKILAMVADNASSNDTQTSALDKLVNSFREEARVRCFNHTLALSAKSLLKPFNPALGSTARGETETEDGPDEAMPDQDDVEPEDDNEDDGDDDDEQGASLDDDVNDGIDELEQLDEDEREELLDNTAAVRSVVSKVHENASMFFHMLTRCQI